MQTTLGSALHYPQRNINIIANLIIKPYAIIEAGVKSRCLLKRKGGRERKEEKNCFPTTRTEDTYIMYSIVIQQGIVYSIVGQTCIVFQRRGEANSQYRGAVSTLNLSSRYTKIFQKRLPSTVTRVEVLYPNAGSLNTLHTQEQRSYIAEYPTVGASDTLALIIKYLHF